MANQTTGTNTLPTALLGVIISIAIVDTKKENIFKHENTKNSLPDMT
jgi:hypothetical protein